MSRHSITLGGVTVDVPTNWREITDQLEDVADPPPTLADAADDVGALQFSVARYASGPVPDPTPADLLGMALQLGATHGLGEPREQIADVGALRLGAVSYHDGDTFLRIWYVSDGRSIAKVTYVCPWRLRRKQRATCEAIVRSLRFEPN